MGNRNRTVIGVDIGGTKIAAHVTHNGRDSLVQAVIPCPAHEGAEAVLSAVIGVCQSLRAQVSQPVDAVGIGTAGQVDIARGMVIGANENLTGWAGTPIVARVGEALGLPVWLENDVRALAIGESAHGAGMGYPHVLCVAVGTGIGGALILNGRVWQGAHYSAGEIGYMRARRDHEGWQTIEQLASGTGLEREYHARSGAMLGEPRLSLRQIAARAEEGEALADAVIREGATLVGGVLSAVLCFVDPAVLVIGGGVPQIGERWWTPFLAALRDFPLASTRGIPVVPAQLGTRAGMIGAAQLALDRLAEQGGAS